MQRGLTLEEKPPVVQALTLPLVSGSETTSPDWVWLSVEVVLPLVECDVVVVGVVEEVLWFVDDEVVPPVARVRIPEKAIPEITSIRATTTMTTTIPLDLLFCMVIILHTLSSE